MTGAPVPRSGHSIGHRLAVAGGISVAAFAGVMGAIVLNFAERASNEAYDRLLLASAQSMADAIQVDGTSVTVDVPTAAFAMLAIGKEDRVFHRITEEPDRPVTGYADLAARFVFKPGEDVAFFDETFAGAAVRVAATRRLISAAGEPRRVAVFVAETTGSREALASEIRAYALVPLLAACLAAIVMIPLSVRLAMRPVNDLERAVATRGASDLSAIGAAVVPTEIAPLVDQLNHFIGRLRDTLERNRIFIAEAAHQLRTPLAALRGMAEVAAAETDPAQLRGQVDRIRRNAVAASRIVNQLLADASVANRLQTGIRETVRLDQLAAEAVNDWVGFGEGQAVRFDVTETAEGGLVEADPAALREAIRNLIENAATHGAADAAIDVTVERPGGDQLSVIVADRGPGIPESEKDRVLRRFERGSTAGEGGTGLGLAIVDQVARAYGGDVVLTDRQGGGLVAEIRLPAMGVAP